MLFSLITLLVGLGVSTHLDNESQQLSGLKFDEVKFWVFKDCNLDKSPELKAFLEGESYKYKDLQIFVSDGSEPRVELLYQGDRTDMIRVGKYTNKAMKILMSELGLERDENQTKEKAEAYKKLDEIFKNAEL